MIRAPTLAALALPALLALAGPGLADPQVACKGISGGHLGPSAACGRLTALLGGKDLSVTLELTRDEPQALAGRLVWQAGGQPVAGPVVEVTAAERALDARDSARLAEGLMRVSDLP